LTTSGKQKATAGILAVAITVLLTYPLIAAWLRLEINNRWISRTYENTAQPLIDFMPGNGIYKYYFTRYLVWLCQQYPENCTLAAPSDSE